MKLADGLGTRGAVQSNTRGHHRNIGGRLREELQFSPNWTAVLGVGVENSVIDATLLQNNGTSRIEVDRSFMNVAPEAALIWTASPEIETHLRVGTGYGIPGIGNLTTDSTGLPGNNTELDTQRNVGVELGMDARQLFDILDFSLAGYYEWFFDEFVTQSPGPGLSSFTSNAPEAEHRGVELAMALYPFRGGDPLWEGLYLKTAYTFNDYTDFTEVINGVSFDRSGNEIPGVERHLLNAKLGYESPFHVGGWLEFNYVGDFFVNNSNTLEFPHYHLLNLNLHYGDNWDGKLVSGVEIFFEVQNLLDKDYIESANVVTDDVVNTPTSLANKAAFFAGSERSFFGGVRLKF